METFLLNFETCDNLPLFRFNEALFRSPNLLGHLHKSTAFVNKVNEFGACGRLTTSGNSIITDI